MRHTRRMTAQNMAALAFSALTGSATLAQTNATDLPLPPSRDGYAGQCSYPYKRPRCPAPFERYIIGERVWLEQDAGGLKKGMHEALVEGGKCYFVPFKEEYPMLADSPEWEEMAQNCSVLKMPPGYVAEPPPPDGRIMKDRAANIARYNRMKELEAAAEAADRARQQAEARTQEATPLPASASPVLPNGQKWYQVPNYLPPVVDYNNLSSTQQVINPGTVYKEVHCQLSNGLKVEPGSGLILDNRMLVYVERQNCSLTPMVEVVQGGQSPSPFPTAQPLLEALEKTIPTSSALFSGELGAAQDIGTKFYPGKAIVAPFGPMAGFSSLNTIYKASRGIPNNQPVRVEVGGCTPAEPKPLPLPAQWWLQPNLLPPEAKPQELLPPNPTCDGPNNRRLANGAKVPVGGVVMFDNKTMYAVPKEGGLKSTVQLPDKAFNMASAHPEIKFVGRGIGRVPLPPNSSTPQPAFLPMVAGYEASVYLLGAISVMLGAKSLEAIQNSPQSVTAYPNVITLKRPGVGGSTLADDLILTMEKNKVSSTETGTIGAVTAATSVEKAENSEPCVPPDWKMTSPLTLPTDAVRGDVSPGNPSALGIEDPQYYAKILKPNGLFLGRKGQQYEVRELSGTQERFLTLFNVLALGAYKINSDDNTKLYCKLPNGAGFIGFRSESTDNSGIPDSKGGPPTIDVNIRNIGFRKIKWVP